MISIAGMLKLYYYFALNSTSMHECQGKISFSEETLQICIVIYICKGV